MTPNLKYNVSDLAEKQHEEERLQILKSSNILDTEDEDCFDSIVYILQSVFKIPIAMVTLLDENRLWVKSKAGVSFKEIPRNLSICAHTILYNNVTVIHDLREDNRFSAMSRPADLEDVRFYAGAPIIAEGGYKLGAVCIMDTESRYDFTAEDSIKLAEYASIVSNLIMMRRTITQETEKSCAKSEFLYDLGHELKTPLGVISGISKILMNAEGIASDKKRLLNVLYQSAISLSELVTSINDLNMIENRRLVLDEEDFSLRKLMREIEMMMGALAKSKGLKIEFEDKAVKGIRIRADRIRLKQVLINLIGNAIKYTDTGKITVRAFSTSPTLQDDRYVEFQVTDTGIGIPKEEQDKVFNRFSRACNHVHRREGAGLGLTISKQIIEQMRGIINFESAPDQGSKFWVCIPNFSLC